MSAISYLKQSPNPRTLIVSQRLVMPSISRCLIYEFEDLVHGIDSVDIVALPTSLAPSRWRYKLGRAIDQTIGARGAKGSSRRPYVDRDYELLFLACESVPDLAHMGDLRRWLASSRISVCYVQEIWERDIPRRTGEIEMLRQFDLIFVSCQGSVASLAEATGRPCAYLAPGVDALAFCPYPESPPRVIDFYSMGRRAAKTHQALLKLSREQGVFYLYDSTTGNKAASVPPGTGRIWATDVADHRFLLSQLVKRTRYYLVNCAKVNYSDQTRGQQEVGTRFFEGSAGGAIMIGQAPQCPTFQELFGWQDAVIPMPYNSVDIADVVRHVDADPHRVDRIRNNNVRYTLRRHDWVYRWMQILNAAGLEPDPAACTRRARLEERAASIEKDLGVTV